MSARNFSDIPHIPTPSPLSHHQVRKCCEIARKFVKLNFRRWKVSADLQIALASWIRDNIGLYWLIWHIFGNFVEDMVFPCQYHENKFKRISRYYYFTLFTLYVIMQKKSIYYLPCSLEIPLSTRKQNLEL